MKNKRKKHKIIKKHQRNSNKKIDWMFWFGLIQTTISLLNLLLK